MGIAITYTIANLVLLGNFFISPINWPKNKKYEYQLSIIKNMNDLVEIKCKCEVMKNFSLI